VVSANFVIFISKGEFIMAVNVNKDDCIGCGACVDTCPCSALTIVEDKCTVDEATCAECGACTDVCPVGALSL
jgi:ferredoxin